MTQRIIKTLDDVAARQFFDSIKIPSQKPRLAFGINEYSRALLKHGLIDGFIDDFWREATYLNKPVYRLKEIDNESMVISCVTSNYCITALENLEKKGVVNYVDYFKIADASNDFLPQVHAIRETRLDYAKHRENYKWVRSLLQDDDSKDIFDRVLDFRLTGNLQSMSVFTYGTEKQYFKPCIQLKPGEVFVDGGGFDGYTVLQFVERCPDYERIIYFEPSARMMNVSKRNLVHIERIDYYELALYDKDTNLHFDDNAGSASRVSESGATTIKAVTLDSVIEENVSFIKFDLEGSELEALAGAANCIEKSKPNLALSVYHSPTHFWEIPKLVTSINKKYKLFFGHYTEGWSESVMYFVG